MKGIQFLTDENWQRTSVLIDLKKYGDLWEDFQDTLMAQSRMNEPRESLASVKIRLRRQGKLSA